MTRTSAIYNHAATLDQECRDAYQLYLEQYLATAEAVTNGALVNARGKALGFHAVALVTGVGHHMRRKAYATEELRDHVERHPVKTYQQFESEWLHVYLGGAA